MLPEPYYKELGNKKMFLIFARSLRDFQIIQESWHKNNKLLCIKKWTNENIFSTGLKEDFFNLHNPQKTSPRTNCHVLCRWIFAEIS